jgi:hypothetical protein
MNAVRILCLLGQFEFWTPKTPGDFGLILLLVSNALLWDRDRRITADYERLKKRFDDQFYPIDWRTRK